MFLRNIIVFFALPNDYRLTKKRRLMKFSLHRTMTLVATVLITLATSMSSAQFLETVKRANPNVCVSAGNWDEFRRQYPALDIYANTFKRSHEFFA